MKTKYYCVLMTTFELPATWRVVEIPYIANISVTKDYHGMVYPFLTDFLLYRKRVQLFYSNKEIEPT
jgi:hypothetical protein